MSSASDVLEKVPLFAGLNRKGMRELATAAKPVEYKAGVTITDQDALGVGFFVVTDGELVVRIGDREVARLGPGDYFGEMALIDRGPRSATIVTETEVKCLGFSGWAFRPFVISHPEVAWNLLEIMVKRVREADRRSSQ